MTLEFVPQKKIIIVALAVILVLYIVFQARNVLLGPQINIISPTENETLPGPIIEVEGTAKNVSFLTLNDKQIFVDDSSHFKERLLPAPGLVILKLVGKDRFGRIKETSVNIVVTSNNTP